MEFLDTYLGGVALVALSGLISTLGLLITRKYFDLDKLRASHDVGGYLISIVGTLYAVLLGLIVVDSMQKFSQAREVTEREANCVADVYMLASCMQEPKGGQVRELCARYVDQVLQVEWKDMDNGHDCPGARSMAVELMQLLMNYEPETENQKALYPQMVADVTQVWQCRRARINMATIGIPVPEWISLIAGGVVTIFFTYFFGLENLRLQLIMTFMVSTLISLNVILVLLFGYPFSGDLNISDKPFQIDKAIFEKRLDQVP